MDRSRVRDLLEGIRRQEVDIDEALETLARLPAEDLGYAVVDHHRSLRVGFPEVIYGQGKTVEEIEGITSRMLASGNNVLITRLDGDKAAVLEPRFSDAAYHPRSRLMTISPRPVEIRGKGTVVVVSAGTSDRPVAEEAALSAEALGNAVVVVQDVGVAGLHRLVGRLPALREARVLIVVAGMEGALPSVVAGLVAAPVIAVPTSVGYGAAFGGVAALLGMLTSCASGVTVVNIDNGFGAAYAASLINRT